MGWGRGKAATIRDSFSETEKAEWKPRIIGSSTFEFKRGNERVIRLHQTDIIVEKGKKITLNSGGWKTPTTKKRMNDFLNQYGYCVWQDKGELYVSNGKGYGDKYSVLFYDGIVLPDAFTDKKSIAKGQKLKDQQLKLKKQIIEFCKLLTLDNFPRPGAGDCWVCMRMGEGTDHLMNHIKEGYLHGTLIVNAILGNGYRKEQLGLFFPNDEGRAFIDIDRTRRYLRKYLCKQFGIITR